MTASPMTGRRALVCQHRFPEHDRERGSQRVLDVIDGLLSNGWQVSFASTSVERAPRYERELVRRGVPFHVGWDASAEAFVRDGRFDVAIVAFWHVAEHVTADLRAWSPSTVVVVDSVDLHFVREARRRVVGGTAVPFDEAYGDLTARELEAYRRADAVLCVSDEERRLLDAVLGVAAGRTVPLGEHVRPSPLAVADRRGLLFVGNFRHLPNLEALRWLGDDVLPRVDPDLLAAHPLRIVGSAVDDRVRSVAEGMLSAELVGWVPSVEPELHRARIVVVPLLHGGGVKGKTLQALMAGTPVVSTPVGVEGILDADEGNDPQATGAVVARSPRRFAAGITELLIDDDAWAAVAAAGTRTAATHHLDVAARQLHDVLTDLLADLRSAGVGRQDPAGGLLGLGDAVARHLPGATGVAVAGADRLVDGLTVLTGLEVVAVPAPDAPLDLRSTGDRPLVVVAASAYRWAHTDADRRAWLASGGGLVEESDGFRLYRPDAPQELAAAPPSGTAAPRLVDAVAGTSPPAISVVIATHERAELLERCLASIERQTLDIDHVEVVVVDDGSTDATPAVIERWRDRVRLVARRIDHAGRSAAKNAGIEMATGPIVLLLDDDDEITPELCAEHVLGHVVHPGVGDVVLGHTTWAPDITVTPFMRHVTDVGQELFSYGSIEPGRPLDWRHFWEGRCSFKAELVTAAVESGVGLHDTSLPYTIDIEWAYRLAQVVDLVVHYHPAATSHMTRPVTLDDFCARARAKGRAQWRIAQLHPTDEMRSYCGLALLDAWPTYAGTIDSDRAAVDELERRLGDGGLDESDRERLANLYHRLVVAHTAWGLADARADDVGRPPLSVVVPVWSATPELVGVAADTVDRIRRVSEPGVEVIVVDNGSPHGPAPDAEVVVRNPHNLGVAGAWNQGIRVARGDVVAIANSDCTVEPGWDRALRHAATDGRRIAFPYTDHGDGRHARPDQAGTAGWCFALRRDLAEELGPFDVGFSPAFFEDTDYWHRAWERGVELSPVPAARVHHQRRTSAQHLPDLDATFVANRRRYEAKHGLGLDARPPFWDRVVVEYPPPATVRLGRPDLGTDDPGRPRVFGVGLSKTGTSSLHAALAHLGFRSVHHGDDALRSSVTGAIADGRPPLERVDATIDAFCDVPAVVDHFAVLDAAYPGSRFVLTVRDVDALVESHRRHAERNRSLRDAGLPHGSLLDVDPGDLVTRAVAHEAAVRAHFADREGQLLVIDICRGEGWERLAPFLGWGRIPEKPFPWENATDDETLVPMGGSSVAVP